jgi:hypothetical protein
VRRPASLLVEASSDDTEFENRQLAADDDDDLCQFSNRMSSSQFQRHRDVIDDTKVRMNRSGESGDFLV